MQHRQNASHLNTILLTSIDAIDMESEAWQLMPSTMRDMTSHKGDPCKGDNVRVEVEDEDEDEDEDDDEDPPTLAFEGDVDAALFDVDSSALVVSRTS